MQIYQKEICWKMPVKEKKVFLTFDDGPHPVVTPQVLDILESYQVKAGFFCLGRQVEVYPGLYEKLILAGHTTGNHSYSHPDGWKTLTKKYMADVKKAGDYVVSPLFRPPYGRLKPAQFRQLKQEYKIIMYDVLSMDYDRDLTNEQVIRNVVDNVSPGSIIVMHDHEKTIQRMPKVLPVIIEKLQREGWSFGQL